MRPTIDPWEDRVPAVEAILGAREYGLSLRQAAAAAGLHAPVDEGAAGGGPFELPLGQRAAA